MSEENGKPKADFEFDDALPDKVVDIKCKDNVKRRFLLRVMGGPEMATWMGMFAARIKAEREGNHNYEGVTADLIALCLYDEEGNRVPRETIKGWTAPVQNALFDICQDMNNLDKDAKEKAKKGSAR